MSSPSCHIADESFTDTIAENNALMAKETEGLDLDLELLKRGVGALLRDETKGHYYIIKGDDGKTAIAQLMITYEWSDWRCSNIWWIQSVYVHPEHRRRGLFKQLYKHAQEQSRVAGACGLRLYADTDNVRAHTAYENLGMTSHYKVYEQLNTDY